MLTDDYKIFIASTTTAGASGTTLITSAAVDTAGYRSCTFIVPLGTIAGTAVTSIKVQQSSDDGASDTYDDIATSNQTIADTDDDKLRYVDIENLQKRYLKLLVTRGTAAATIGGILVFLGRSRSRPVTHGTGVTGEQIFNPVEGSA